MGDEKLEVLPGDLIDRVSPSEKVERVDPGELDVVAKVLAMAYADDPVHLWAMPRAATRLTDSIAFFTFILRRMRPHRWEVFATADRCAVAVMAPVGQKHREYHECARYLPALVCTISPAAEYFDWIETFRPKVDHRDLEFIGCLPEQRSKGLGSLILSSMLAEADREGLPVWAFLSNPRNLSFYRRLGFDIGPEDRRGNNTPPVTSIWRLVMPLIPPGSIM